MNKQTISKDYANDMIFELEKAFWDERGKGARFRLTTLGRDFFKTKCLPMIQSNEIPDMVAAIEGVLKENGIVSGISVEVDGRLLRVRIAGCVHRPVEDRLVAMDTKPFACLPANMITLAIDSKLNRPSELAEIKLADGACQILIVLFDKKPF
jgi:hypothetical protein